MADGCAIRENFESFSRVAVRRLGRLLPDARWTSLPFMDLRNKKGIKANILRSCSMRVKCFIETDGGFKPTPSKTDLAHHNPFTTALKNMGNKTSEKQNNVRVEIRKATKLLSPLQLEREYQEWILQMHAQYDEVDCGEDKPVLIVSPPNKKELGISSDVVRVHQVLKRKEKTWKHGQKVKVLKGACAGFHKTTIYATIEYFLLEGFEGDAGGEARIICRPMDIAEENGCFLSVGDKDASLDIQLSKSLPVTVIDSGKLVPVESIDWNNQLKKKQQKYPASIDLPSSSPSQHFMVDETDSNHKIKSFEKKAIVDPPCRSGKCRLLTDDQSPEIIVRVGSTFPTLEIAYYDIHNNRANFQSIPDVTVKLQTAKGLHLDVHGMKSCLSADRMTLNIMGEMVTSNEVDKIRPHYKATLYIASRDVPLSLSITCQVYPGFLDHVELKPNITEEQLVPGFIFKDLELEMFDSYGNHVIQGLEISLAVAGFNILDHGKIFKVDDKGRINLGGLLKLTAGYGEHASISVIVENKTIFKQEFSAVRRNLRIASEVPNFCVAGAYLENIEFEVVNPDGDVDTKIHHNDKDGQFHMLTIKSDLYNAEESIRFTFKHGRCTIPSIFVPDIGGMFSFEAAHSLYTRLSLVVKVPVKKMSKVKSVGEPLLDKSIAHLEELPPYVQEDGLMISPVNYDDKILGSICNLGEKICEIENHLYDFKKQKTEIEEEILRLIEKVPRWLPDYRESMLTKDELSNKIKSMENSATSVLCNLSTQKRQHNYFLDDVIGVVALLGTVQSSQLSRMLAEYLGEDKMLAVICRSFDAVSSLESYKQSGAIDSERALHAEAAALGRAISKRFDVMCFEDIRPYTGDLQPNDSQRKLAMVDPILPNGTKPAGFIGYAVNMVELDINHLQTRTASGHGLRETVLFSLFKRLQVYSTRECMVAARVCIEDGAVSLDGGILRENGTLSLGFGNPLIYFPCENQMVLPPETEGIIAQIEEKKIELKSTEEIIGQVTKYLKKYQKKFKKKNEKYLKLADRTPAMTALLEYKPEIGDKSNMTGQHS